MEEGNSIIYGLEHQTRALCAQYECDAIRFLIGTQSLKPNSNQVHVVELEEDTGALHTKVYRHDVGEIWHLKCSPHDAATLMTTHNSYDPDTSQCTMGVSVFKLPTLDVIPKDLDELSAMQGRNAEEMELIKTIIPEKPEEEIRCSEWNPTDPNSIGIVFDNKVSVRDMAANRDVLTIVPEGRSRLKFSGGKWSLQAHHQFAVLQDTHIRCYDTRTECSKPAWSVEHAHRQLCRDLDFNPNRQFHLASAGDDAALNIWDYRSGKEPIFSRTDHSHWVWSVRYNSYHEQLLVTGSSDGRALLTAAASVCHLDHTAAPLLEDGVLQSYEQHEHSVYCVEWSSADPWTFASLSYDGRLVLSRVPRHFKYKILL
ncbi:EARP-interacting protein homolog [Leptidea sinapis]|uniref:EARP-interacting protein homolog n=1 Tax=Leptidea sinapis TaxID=189913 RepID=UPI0021C2C3E2|nr:EARP-interacting protein homolog [Leptidea sinapis]XP_050671389.1 EARP-interacting protein homolog [Leptidea sinapis]XP_050671390.1 EARP-interacting protein homolog [Leptidea sinapis]